MRGPIKVDIILIMKILNIGITMIMLEKNDFQRILKNFAKVKNNADQMNHAKTHGVMI